MAAERALATEGVFQYFSTQGGSSLTSAKSSRVASSVQASSVPGAAGGGEPSFVLRVHLIQI